VGDGELNDENEGRASGKDLNTALYFTDYMTWRSSEFARNLLTVCTYP
jgi:hypothetical protein